MNNFINDVAANISNIRKVLTKDSSVLLITHANCLDGMGCQMVMQTVMPQAMVVKMSPAKTDDYVSKLNPKLFDAIILADISTKDTTFLSNPNVIMIDHHDSALYLNDPDNLVFVNGSFCGTKLLLTMLQMVFKESYKFDDLVTVVNDHDMWLLKDNRSKALNRLFYKYGDQDFFKRFRHMKANINKEEFDWYEAEKQKTIKRATELEMFDLGCGVGVYFDNEYDNDLMNEVLDSSGFTCIVTYKPNFGGASVRSKNSQINIGRILSDIGAGGGHRAAGGFRAKDHKQFQSIIENFMREVNSKLNPEPLPF